jgi:hypothetical protein
MSGKERQEEMALAVFLHAAFLALRWILSVRLRQLWKEPVDMFFDFLSKVFSKGS